MLKYVLLFILWIIIGVIMIFIGIIQYCSKVDKMFGTDGLRIWFEYLKMFTNFRCDHTSSIKRFFLYGSGSLILWPTAMSNLYDIMDNALTSTIMDYAKQEESTT